MVTSEIPINLTFIHVCRTLDLVAGVAACDAKMHVRTSDLTPQIHRENQSTDSTERQWRMYE
jgi:hypothetical protein